jgi:hypothetical protein
LRDVAGFCRAGEVLLTRQRHEERKMPHEHVESGLRLSACCTVTSDTRRIQGHGSLWLAHVSPS